LCRLRNSTNSSIRSISISNQFLTRQLRLKVVQAQ
jgi:hypothetical protein